MKDFLLELKREKTVPAPPSLAAPVDVKWYNFALICCIVALSMTELLGIQRQDFPFFPRVSPFIYLNVNLCGLPTLCGLEMLQWFVGLCLHVGVDHSLFF